jgi:uncharacterized FlaG/YvyC family protein
MNKKINILVSGYGNLGHHIYKALYSSGRFNIKIISKTYKKNLPSKFIPDLIWVLKKDEYVKKEIYRLKKLFPYALFVSSSAAIDINEIKVDSLVTLYPLGTFKKNHLGNVLRRSPFFLEFGSHISEDHKKTIKEVCIALGIKPVELSYKERIKLHLAAVFANNFTNAIMHAAVGLAGKNAKYLLPIIQQTFENIQKLNPAITQTGPAVRSDLNTIRKHLDFLADQKELKKIYITITDYIKNHVRKNGI